jgi:hypothetical protein
MANHHGDYNENRSSEIWKTRTDPDNGLHARPELQRFSDRCCGDHDGLVPVEAPQAMKKTVLNAACQIVNADEVGEMVGDDQIARFARRAPKPMTGRTRKRCVKPRLP